MSTKAYDGYRFVHGRLGDFAQLVKQETIEALALELKPGGIGEMRFAFRDFLNKDMDLGMLDELSMLMGWRGWCNRTGGYCYVLPVYDYGAVRKRVLMSLSTKDWIQPYSYWNNTDRDVLVPPLEWELRGEEWNRIDRVPDFWIETFNLWSVTAIEVEHLQRKAEAK